MKTKVVFYFPWKEISGGPYYLTRLANELAKDLAYDVFYTDYANGLSEPLLDQSVKRIIVPDNDITLYIKEEVTIITPIYWACWIREMNPKSKILFLNWHNCCIPVLKDSWQLNNQTLNLFLNLVKDTKSVFFGDFSHWMAQNTKSIIFEKKYVPVTLPHKKLVPQHHIVNDSEINLGVLGRLCADKIYSVINLLENFQKLNTTRKKNLYIIGDGPDKGLIQEEKYNDVKIFFKGTVTGKDLDEFISNKIDGLFAMGTSILESAAIKLPSIIMPHNMHPFHCDEYVYLQNSKDYCLGWYDTQVADIGLKPIKLSQVISDIYDNNLKKDLGDQAFEYYLNNHTIETAIVPLKNAISTTELTYKKFNSLTNNFFITIRHFPLFKKSIAQLRRNSQGVISFTILKRLTVATLQNTEIPNRKILFFFNIPLLVMKKESTKRIVKPYMPRFNFFRSQINNLISRITTPILSRLDAIESKVNTTTETVLVMSNIVKMDTCEKLVPESSFQYFTGDIKDDYLRLIQNLDDKSIEVLVRVLSRIQKYRKEHSNYFHFTEFERGELAKIHDLHSSSILKLSDRCYAYGRYLLPIKIISTTVFYYDHFLGFVNNLDAIRDKEIIDVGGFIGDSALVLSKYTNKNVHVFEPVTKLYDLSVRTIELNNLKNVILNKEALGSKTSDMMISISGDTSSLCGSINQDSELEPVKVITLDDYVSKNNLSVGLIKVDVEGFEQDFLKGAINTIRSQRPALLLSIYHNADDFFKIKPMIESWNLGYKFKVAKPSDHTILIDTTLIAET